MLTVCVQRTPVRRAFGKVDGQEYVLERRYNKEGCVVEVEKLVVITDRHQVDVPIASEIHEYIINGRQTSMRLQPGSFICIIKCNTCHDFVANHMPQR